MNIFVVVYLLIPTSNHNCYPLCIDESELYIFWFLHQTTTKNKRMLLNECCISFDSYIKPQLAFRSLIYFHVVYLLIPTSNHNINNKVNYRESVVYLLIPTSNHNTDHLRCREPQLYIFWFLHQTTTYLNHRLIPALLYIFWFLHQTTTKKLRNHVTSCCISFDSYIKPQPTD